jgi:hypothetical protein
MTKRPRVLIQSSIDFNPDDWHVGRFSLLAKEIGRWADVVARDREPDATGSDPVIVGLNRARFDEIWIIAVDTGTAFTPDEIAAMNRFHRDGGGVLSARDHDNMGLWLRSVEAVGDANFFHDPSCCEPDPARHTRDDTETPGIDWPNYHSGRNGDVQPVTVIEPLHPLMRNPSAASGHIESFPAHPHEGAVGTPPGRSRARSIARGRSRATGRDFALAVAFERTENAPGRAIAESSFHHFVDYNWDTSKGAPSFVIEPAGDAIAKNPRLLDDIRTYVRNCVEWLAPI